MAFSTNRSVQSIMDLVKRIDYANRNFTHFKQGWTSDMGRIYIRNGPPDDIQRDTSSDESRFCEKGLSDMEICFRKKTGLYVH